MRGFHLALALVKDRGAVCQHTDARAANPLYKKDLLDLVSASVQVLLHSTKRTFQFSFLLPKPNFPWLPEQQIHRTKTENISRERGR